MGAGKIALMRVAEKKENPIKQAWDALTDDDGPPEAQPENADKPGKNAGKTAPRRGRSGSADEVEDFRHSGLRGGRGQVFGSAQPSLAIRALIASGLNSASSRSAVC